MGRMYEIIQLWYIKVVFGAVLTIVAPVKTSIIIIYVMIFLDTITGSICAINSKKFNSRSFKKNLNKILLYSLCVITTRLVEVGALQNSTVTLTQVAAGFLIITEAISVLENLNILGLPMSFNILNIIYKQIRLGTIQEMVAQSQEEKSEVKDIEDMLYLQIPNIASNETRKLLEIEIEIWIGVAKEIIHYFNGQKKFDNELIYYKISSIIQIGFQEIRQNWVDEKISKESIDILENLEKPRVEVFMTDIKEICYRITSSTKKKDEILKKITILLYQMMADVQKYEKEIPEIKNNP